MTHLPAELRGIYPTWLNKHNAPIAARGECMKCLFSSHYVIRLNRCFSIAVSKFFEIFTYSDAMVYDYSTKRSRRDQAACRPDQSPPCR